MASRLPAELLSNIAENLADDHPSLRHLAQTCQRALDPCRQVLFRHVKLARRPNYAQFEEAPYDRFYAVIEANPHIASFIHSLVISNPPTWRSPTFPGILEHIANAGCLRVLIFSPPNQWDQWEDVLEAALIDLLKRSSLLQTIRLDQFCPPDGMDRILAAATSPHVVDVGFVYYPSSLDFDEEDEDPSEDGSTNDEEEENVTDDSTDDDPDNAGTGSENDDAVSRSDRRLLTTLKIGKSSEHLIDWILSSPSRMSVSNLKTLIIDGDEGDSRAAATKIIPICANTLEQLVWIEPSIADPDYRHPEGGINLRGLQHVREMTVYFVVDYEELTRGNFEGCGFPPNLEHLVVVAEPHNIGFKQSIEDWGEFDHGLVEHISGLKHLKSIRLKFFIPHGYYVTARTTQGQEEFEAAFPELKATGLKVVAELATNMTYSKVYSPIREAVASIRRN